MIGLTIPLLARGVVRLVSNGPSGAFPANTMLDLTE